jgi:hypothetical protein
VALLKNAPDTLLSLWWIAKRGFNIELCADKINFKVADTSEVVYAEKCDNKNRQWSVDLYALMNVKFDFN